jgi:hypothetical protein
MLIEDFNPQNIMKIVMLKTRKKWIRFNFFSDTNIMIIGVFCTEQENLNITYNVEHFSKNLLCLSKLVKVKCPMGNKNFQINEVQTYFQNNDSIFKVEFEAHADFKKDLLTQLEDRSMSRCTKPDLNQLNFILRKGKFYVHVPYDFPMCNTEIPFSFGKNTVKVASLSPVDLN